MRTITLLCALLIGINLSAQNKIVGNKLTEKQVIEKSHIDFTKECIVFTIHGLIEIDGHTFLNDTCSHPVIYMADLEGVVLRDTIHKISYKRRLCEVKDCKVLHLEKNYYLVRDHTDDWRGLTPLTINTPSHVILDTIKQ